MNQSSRDSFNPLDELMENLSESVKVFNKGCYSIFLFGNFIMFFIFLFIGIHLFLSAREIEYKEKINAKNLEYLKKRGRVGTTICFILAIGFLVKGLPIFFLWCISPFPVPLFFQWRNIPLSYQIDNCFRFNYLKSTILNILNLNRYFIR